MNKLGFVTRHAEAVRRAGRANGGIHRGRGFWGVDAVFKLGQLRKQFPALYQ